MIEWLPYFQQLFTVATPIEDFLLTPTSSHVWQYTVQIAYFDIQAQMSTLSFEKLSALLHLFAVAVVFAAELVHARWLVGFVRALSMVVAAFLRHHQVQSHRFSLRCPSNLCVPVQISTRRWP